MRKQHIGKYTLLFPHNPGHSNAYCLLLADQGATQLDFQKTPFSLKILCLLGGKDSSKGKGCMQHLLSYLRQLHVASHAAGALGHGVLGIITCRSPKACQSKKGVSCSLFHCATDTPSYAQQIRSILAAHGCLRLET